MTTTAAEPFVWNKYDCWHLIELHNLWHDGDELHRRMEQVCMAQKDRIDLAANKEIGYNFQKRAAFAEARAILAENELIPTNTIQGKTCKACGKPFRAVGYYNPPQGDRACPPEARIVYKCGCETVFASCETRTDFQRANGRRINKRW